MLSRLLGFGHQPTDNVWFSRNIHNNELQQWMLVVRDRKLELVRTAHGNYTFSYTYEAGWTPDRERQKPSSRPRGHLGNGYDHWIILHIGWTRLSEKEIDRCFDSARAHYPPALSWTQCQDFLHRFAERFIDRRDVHWRFFIDNVDIRCRCVPELPPPPAVLFQAAEARNTHNVDTFNAWQGGYSRAQQQNLALNNQIMQNNQAFNMGGYGS